MLYNKDQLSIIHNDTHFYSSPSSDKKRTSYTRYFRYWRFLVACHKNAFPLPSSIDLEVKNDDKKRFIANDDHYVFKIPNTTGIH